MICPYGKPVIGKIDRFGKPVIAPCRTCYVCRSTRIKQWSDRLKYEWTHTSSAAFLRLSYDDNHLEYENNCPDNLPSLRRSTLHRFIDNLRHYCKKHKDEIYGCNPHFTYYACGEYGDIASRPHYHVIVFGMDRNTCRKIFKSVWHNGFVQVLPLKRGGIRYVMKYMESQTYGDLSDRVYFDNGLEAPFFSFTPGIGSGLYTSHREELNEKGYISFGARRVYPTPYYARKLYSYNRRYNRSRNEELFRSRDALWNTVRSTFPGMKSLDEYSAHISRVRESNMQAKSSKGLHITYINYFHDGG